MLSVVLSWFQKTKELTDTINMFNEGKYQDVFDKITFSIENDGIDNIPMNAILLHAKAGLMTGNSRTSINELTYLLAMPNSNYQRMTLHLLRAKAYLNIGEISGAFNESKSIYGNSVISSEIEEATKLFEEKKYSYDSIKRLISLCPESSEALMIAAYFYKKQNDDENFEKYAALVLKYDPSNKEIKHKLTKYYVCKLRLTDAYSLVKNCTNNTNCQKLDVSDMDNYKQFCSKNNKISLKERIVEVKELIHRKAYNEAFVVLNSIIKSDPLFKESYYQRAKIFVDNDDIESAISDLRKASKIPKARSLLERLQSWYSFQPYRVLHLKEGSSYDDALMKYRILAKKWNPDRIHQPLGKAIAKSKLSQLNRAIDAIKDYYEFNYINNDDMFDDFGFMTLVDAF